MPMLIRFKSLVLLLGIALVAGCASQPAGSPAQAPGAGTPKTEAPAPSTAEPKMGGTLTVGVARNATTLYPSHSNALPDIAANFFLYDALVITDDKGQIQPLLAKRWSASEDGNVWTFELRDDVTFHSGRKFTSRDVKFHFDQWQESITKGKIDTIDKVEIDGDYKVIITLKYPNLVFLSMISQSEWSYGGIPDSEAVREYGEEYGIDPKSVSGTGPFKLKDWVRDDRITLLRNESYKWGPPMYKNQAAPFVESIVLRTIPEAATRAAELEVGSIDMDLELSAAEAPRLESTKGVKVVSAPRITAHHFGFNMDKWQDERVRLAIAHAVDQNALVSGVFNGYAEPAVGLWHNSIEGHTPDAEAAKFHPAFDLNKARQLLDEAGWKEGARGIREKDGTPLSLNMLVYVDWQEQLAIAVQANLRQIGVEMKVRRLEYAAWQTAVTNGEYDMFAANGAHSTADLSYWWLTSSLPYPNYARVRGIDDLFKITQTTTDRNARIKAFQDIERYLVADAKFIPMPHTTWLFAHRDTVNFAYWDPIHGIQKGLDLWVAK